MKNTLERHVKIICFYFLVTMGSCTPINERLKGNSFEEFVFEKKIGEYIFRLRPLPAEKLFRMNYEDTLSSERRLEVIKEYSDFDYFLFEVEIRGFDETIANYEPSGKSSNKDEKVKFYLFGMQESVKLINKQGDELPCVVYFQEQLSQMINVNRFIVGFVKHEVPYKLLQYNNPYLDCGTVNISLEI